MRKLLYLLGFCGCAAVAQPIIPYTAYTYLFMTNQNAGAARTYVGVGEWTTNTVGAVSNFTALINYDNVPGATDPVYFDDQRYDLSGLSQAGSLPGAHTNLLIFAEPAVPPGGVATTAKKVITPFWVDNMLSTYDADAARTQLGVSTFAVFFNGGQINNPNFTNSTGITWNTSGTNIDLVVAPGGSSFFVNGANVVAPNITNTTDLTWSVDGTGTNVVVNMLAGAIGQVISHDGTRWTNNSAIYATPAGGNVGIGETSPAKALDVAGDIQLDTTTNNATGIIWKDATTFLHDYHNITGGTAIPLGRNVFLGEGAGNFTMGSTATETYHGSENTGIGYHVLDAVTLGYANTAVGHNAGTSITTGNLDAAFGAGSLAKNTTGTRNSALGYNALYQNTIGSYNTAVGALALNDSGSNSVSATYNTGVGFEAMKRLLAGTNNVAIGTQAGMYLADGSTAKTLGFGNIYLGSLTTSGSDDATNEIVIGHAGVGLGANTMALGNTNLVDTTVYGNVTFDHLPVTNTVLINTTGGITNTPVGTAGYVLTSGGAGVEPNWADVGTSPSNTVVLPNVAGLASVDVTLHTNVYVLGYTTPGDGGGGEFYWATSSGGLLKKSVTIVNGGVGYSGAVPYTRNIAGGTGTKAILTITNVVGGAVVGGYISTVGAYSVPPGSATNAYERHLLLENPGPETQVAVIRAYGDGDGGNQFWSSTTGCWKRSDRTEVNIQEWGCTPGYVADASPGLQAACYYAIVRSVTLTDPPAVYIPPGTYKLDSTIDVPYMGGGNYLLRVRGAGARQSILGSTWVTGGPVFRIGINDTEWANFGIGGVATAEWQVDGLYFDDAFYASIHNMYFVNLSRAIVMDGASKVYHVDDLHIDYCFVGIHGLQGGAGDYSIREYGSGATNACGFFGEFRGSRIRLTAQGEGATAIKLTYSAGTEISGSYMEQQGIVIAVNATNLIQRISSTDGTNCTLVVTNVADMVYGANRCTNITVAGNSNAVFNGSWPLISGTGATHTYGFKLSYTIIDDGAGSGGYVDMNFDGVITTNDFGTLYGYGVTNALVDVDGNGSITAADDLNSGEFGGFDVDDGHVDWDGDDSVPPDAGDVGNPAIGATGLSGTVMSSHPWQKCTDIAFREVNVPKFVLIDGGYSVTFDRINPEVVFCLTNAHDIRILASDDSSSSVSASYTPLANEAAGGLYSQSVNYMPDPWFTGPIDNWGTIGSVVSGESVRIVNYDVIPGKARALRYNYPATGTTASFIITLDPKQYADLAGKRVSLGAWLMATPGSTYSYARLDLFINSASVAWASWQNDMSTNSFVFCDSSSRSYTTVPSSITSLYLQLMVYKTAPQHGSVNLTGVFIGDYDKSTLSDMQNGNWTLAQPGRYGPDGHARTQLAALPNYVFGGDAPFGSTNVAGGTLYLDGGTPTGTGTSQIKLRTGTGLNPQLTPTIAITITNVPPVGDTVIIDNFTNIWTASPTGLTNILIGANTNECATNLAATLAYLPESVIRATAAGAVANGRALPYKSWYTNVSIGTNGYWSTNYLTISPTAPTDAMAIAGDGKVSLYRPDGTITYWTGDSAAGAGTATLQVTDEVGTVNELRSVRHKFVLANSNTDPDNDVVSIAVAANTPIGGTMSYTLFASDDGVTNVVASGNLMYAATSTNTVVSAVLDDVQGTDLSVPAGCALTWGWAADVATANLLKLSLSVTNDLGGTVLTNYMLFTLPDNSWQKVTKL